MTKSSRNNFKVAALAALIILPALAVFFWANVSWVHQELPYYGQRELDNAGDTIYHKVSDDIVLYNQHGKKITLHDFDSSILLVNIFFSTCPQVCPEMNKQIQAVAEEYLNEPNVEFLSVSIDPETDSIPVLAEYAKLFKADLYKRTFATGSKKEIYDWAINDLLLATEQRGSDFIHDDRVVIIDKERHIRGVLPTRAKTNHEKIELIRRIKDDIENLKYEYRKKTMD